MSYASITPENRPLSSKEITNLMKKSKPVIMGNCYHFFEKYLGYDRYKAFGYARTIIKYIEKLNKIKL